jgi:hypothetical protein
MPQYVLQRIFFSLFCLIRWQKLETSKNIVFDFSLNMQKFVFKKAPEESRIMIDSKEENPSTTFSQKVEAWLASRNRMPGAFAETVEEKFWSLSKEISLPSVDDIEILILPLRIHLVQGEEFGCSLTKKECQEQLCSSLNEYWWPAGIVWDIVDVPMKEIVDTSESSTYGMSKSILREHVWNLKRSKETQQMANKEFRRTIFLGNLIPEHQHSLNTYDIYMFDFIGHESQGSTLFCFINDFFSSNLIVF